MRWRGSSLTVPPGTSAAGEVARAAGHGVHVVKAFDTAFAIDAGRLRRSRELEGFQFPHMTLQEPLGLHWRSAIKLVR